MGKKNNSTIILGAGPAGLAAGYELIKKKNNVRILEKQPSPGGISRTVKYKNYYFDLGGHRFFTKYKFVNDLWSSLLTNETFLTVKRLSRIYYKNKFFNYPLKPLNAFISLGLKDTLIAIISFIYAKLIPVKPENTFTAWVSNKFGRFLFNIFFKAYTEKVWGISCDEISDKWASQRIKKLSLLSAILNAFCPSLGKTDSLIDEFRYPVYGPGMMYTALMDKIILKNGKVELNSKVTEINTKDNCCIGVKLASGEYLEASDFISTIPISELVKMIRPYPPKEVIEAAQELEYRSFIVVALVIDKQDIFSDNWIYIHSPEIKIGRIQNTKNWSKAMVPDQTTTVLTLEYFCNENDSFWNKSDKYLVKFGKYELLKLKMIDKENIILDFCVVRVPKAYPIYSNNYSFNLKVIKDYLDSISNLQAAGRCGMFKYNNMDHSILTGILAARNILGENNNIWAINTGDTYHES